MSLRIPAALLLLLSCLPGCSRQEPPAPCFLTWNAEGKSFPQVPLPEAEQHLEPGLFPAAGIVSHHLLAGNLISAWFRELAAARTVETFLIVSPLHRGTGTNHFSLADGIWKTAAGTVKSDPGLTSFLARQLGVKPESAPFYQEHGVSVLIPFIAAYFPGAKVAAVAFPVETTVNLPLLEKAGKILASCVTGKQRTKNFLLISADFSHHSDQAATRRKDDRSRKFLASPGLDTWFYANCDNQAGIYTIGLLSEKIPESEMVILFHSNSFALSGQAALDITSCFFTFLCEKTAADKLPQAYVYE